MTDLDDLLNELWPLASQHVLACETVDLLQAQGRVLAQSVASSLNVPQHDNSAMDGYALCSADFAVGRAYTVSQRVPAGAVPEQLVQGTVARIFTGAPIPPGADTVVMQEDALLDDSGAVRFERDIRPGQHIRRSGEDIAQGHPVINQGQLLSPMHLGLLASIGVAQVSVYRKLKVGVLVTGSELAEPGQLLKPGQIYNSNATVWAALLHKLGVEVVQLGIVRDHLNETVQALEKLKLCDLILSSGGVSVGEEDHVKAAVERVGHLRSWKVAMKPGKPVAFGQINRSDGTHAWFFGLPGNPVSSSVTFLLLVKPFIRLMQGLSQSQVDWRLQGQIVQSGFEWTKADPRRDEFLRARLNVQTGRVTLFDNQSSGVLTSMQWADGLVRMPKGHTVSHGDKVMYFGFPVLMSDAHL